MRRRLIIFFLVALVYFYLGISWVGALALSGGANILSWLLLSAPFLSIIWLILIRWQRDEEKSSAFDEAIQWAAFFSMGSISFTLALTAIRDGLAFVLLLSGHAEDFLHSTSSFYGILVLTLSLLLLGFFSARYVLDTVEVEVELEKLPPEFDGFTIAQVSDLHIGTTIRKSFVEKVVSRVNELEADAVVLTGDIVDGYVDQLKQDIAALGGLKGKYGRFYIPGNHEYYWHEKEGHAPAVAEFKQMGFSTLVNESEVIEKNGAKLLIAGVPDYMSENPEADPKAALEKNNSADAVKILLAHQPSFAKKAAEAGYDLQLSGHTHGGQFFPWTLIIGWFHQFPRGLGRLDQMWIYVNRGTGYWGPPVRLGASAEISLIRLTARRSS